MCHTWHPQHADADGQDKITPNARRPKSLMPLCALQKLLPQQDPSVSFCPTRIHHASQLQVHTHLLHTGTPPLAAVWPANLLQEQATRHARAEHSRRCRHVKTGARVQGEACSAALLCCLAIAKGSATTKGPTAGDTATTLAPTSRGISASSPPVQHWQCLQGV
jgi:hypothetical protein